MDSQSTDPENVSVICQVSNYIIGSLARSRFFLATITGRYVPDGNGFEISTGGFGLLQHLYTDQKVVYSSSGFAAHGRRHACNVWFDNEEFEARVDRWVIDVFNQESEAKLILLRDDLVQQTEGQIEFRLNCRRGPVRPEKTLADYGLGIRK